MSTHLHFNTAPRSFVALMAVVGLAASTLTAMANTPMRSSGMSRSHGSDQKQQQMPSRPTSGQAQVGSRYGTPSSGTTQNSQTRNQGGKTTGGGPDTTTTPPSTAPSPGSRGSGMGASSR
jgi:hypothetical protein